MKSHDPGSAGQNFWAALFINGFTSSAWPWARCFYALHGHRKAGASCCGVRGHLAAVGRRRRWCCAWPAFGLHHVWGWMDPRLLDKNDPAHYDALVAKQPLPEQRSSSGLRVIAFMGASCSPPTGSAQSLKMDGLTGDDLRKQHLFTYRRGACSWCSSPCSAACWRGTG